MSEVTCKCYNICQNPTRLRNIPFHYSNKPFYTNNLLVANTDHATEVTKYHLEANDRQRDTS